MDSRYKKKPLRFSGIGAGKAIRAHEHHENRKSSRSELYNNLRNIHGSGDDSLFSPYAEEKKQVKKPVENRNFRLEKLRKWPEEKFLKKKLEQSKIRPPFVVGSTAQPRCKPVAGGLNSSKVHKTGIPRFASKLPSSKPTLKKVATKENIPVAQNSKCLKSSKPTFGFSQNPTKTFQKPTVCLSKKGSETIKSTKECFHEDKKNEESCYGGRPGFSQNPTKTFQKPTVCLSKKGSETIKSTKECFHEDKKNEESLSKCRLRNVTSRRKSFAPLEFQFEPELPMLDLSLFIPKVQPPKIDADQTKMPAPEKEASSSKVTEECSPKLENDKMDNISQTSREVSKHEAEKINLEDSKNTQCVSSKPSPLNLPVLASTKTFDTNLLRINEELENSNAEIMCTPKLKVKDAAFTVWRSLRLMKLSETEISPFKNSPTVNSGGMPAATVLQHTNLTQDFNKLRLDSDKGSEVSEASGNSYPSLDISEDVGNQSLVRAKQPQRKVSLLYTPEAKGRYSLRKSVRGDLISFS